MGCFSQGLGTHGTFHHVTDAESPWQNGRTERVGGLLKDLIKMAIDRLEPDREQENETMVHACVAAKNAHYDRLGFTLTRGSSARTTGFHAACAVTVWSTC